MNSARKRPVVIGVLVLLAVAAGIMVFIQILNRNPESTPEEETFISAVETSQEAIKDGVNSSNAEQALFIASDMINNNKPAEARSTAESVSDDWLANNQITNKYTIILDSYRIEGNKDGFASAIEAYKAAASTRDDPALVEATAYLNQAYVDAVFTAPADVAPEQEVP